MPHKKTLKIIFYSVICIILTYYVAILLHEYGHATAAWLFGYKHSPFDISYGNWLLMPVSENVNYHAIFSSGHYMQGGLIGAAGISVTILLFIISLLCINQKNILERPFYFLFFYWLAVINLSELFTYIVTRSFASGDIGEFIYGMHISPFWVFIPGSIFAFLAVYRFFRYEIIKMYYLLNDCNIYIKRLFLYMSFWPLLLLPLYWSMPNTHRVIAIAANILTAIIILFVFIACDPARSWVQKATHH